MKNTATSDAGNAKHGTLEIVTECKDNRLPSLHAMPVMDFDDGMGLVAVGNAIGELALCNYGGPLTARMASCLQPLPFPTID